MFINIDDLYIKKVDSSIIEHYIVQIMNKSVKLSYGRHYVDQTDLKEIKNALFSGYLSSGSYIKKFENLIKKKLKVNFVSVCNSGTSALHLAYLACNLKENDIIILPAVNFVVTAPPSPVVIVFNG